jgi:hypothetical protein
MLPQTLTLTPQHLLLPLLLLLLLLSLLLCCYVCSFRHS